MYSVRCSDVSALDAGRVSPAGRRRNLHIRINKLPPAGVSLPAGAQA